MIFSYIGKIGVWCFLKMNPTQDTPEWFSWHPKKTNLLEFIIGLMIIVVGLVLFQLCLFPIYWLCKKYCGVCWNNNRRNTPTSEASQASQVSQINPQSLEAII
jgi:hypothetical protein